MDSFFGIGAPELVMIALLAGLFLGPHRIRQVMRKLGEYTVQFQRISQSFRSQLNEELDSLESEELKGALREMQDLKQQLSDLQQQVRSIPQDVVGQSQAAINDAQTLLKENGTAPASSTPALPKAVKVEDDPDS